MAFYNEKGWWKSKTVWTGIFSAVSGVLVLFGIPVPLDPETLAGSVMVVVGVLTTIFRAKAETKLVTTTA